MKKYIVPLVGIDCNGLPVTSKTCDHIAEFIARDPTKSVRVITYPLNGKPCCCNLITAMSAYKLEYSDKYGYWFAICNGIEVYIKLNKIDGELRYFTNDINS